MNGKQINKCIRNCDDDEWNFNGEQDSHQIKYDFKRKIIVICLSYEKLIHN